MLMKLTKFLLTIRHFPILMKQDASGPNCSTIRRSSWPNCCEHNKLSPLMVIIDE